MDAPAAAAANVAAIRTRRAGLRQLLAICELSLTTLERAGRGCLQLTELLLESWRDELVEPLRLVHVLQLVLSEIQQRNRRNRVVAEQFARRLRSEHLAAMPGSADPSRPVHTEADVARAADRRFTGVNSHPDAEDRKSVV